MIMTRADVARAVRQPKPMSATARKSLATKQLVSALGSDERAAVTAALEAVNERLAWDVALRQSLSQKYEELTALSAPRPKPTRVPAPQVDGSGPARHTTLEKLDPYQLFEDVGRDKFRASLVNTTQQRLQTAVKAVKARHPGTKPLGRRNYDLVDYIVEYVAGPGY